MRKLSAAVFILLLASAAAGQAPLPPAEAPAPARAAAGEPAGGPGAAAALPLLVTSDSLVIEEEGTVIRFEGKVTVKRGDVVLTCERFTLHARSGDPAQVRTGDAEGGVVITRVDERAEAERASFDLDAGRVVLAGSPRMFRGKDAVKATEIVYSIGDGKASFKGPVEAVISPAGTAPAGGGRGR